ncbi:hypothetical protein E3N88_22947 [Mikania micrantha]|uniref:Integrase zinc-binding domain-containing protein n=1 Tax=Mikania micrantha TaxID=192012 RepID=A0A5N6NBW1_9ASTR|nr:hypothetical protein E3N88_22947 [Mikania micrantha]
MDEMKWVSIVVLQVVLSSVGHVVGWRLGLTLSLKDEMSCGAELLLETKDDGLMYYLNRLWIPNKDDLRMMILDEAHKSRYSIHPGADKMYQDLRALYWWPGMKKDIA